MFGCIVGLRLELRLTLTGLFSVAVFPLEGLREL